MRITSIDNTQNFKGLWGDTIKVNGRKNNYSGLVISDYETKNYYPFGDESIECANNVLKTNSTYKKILENGYTKEVGTDISIKNRLFFTAKQWMKYIGNKMDVGSVERRMIEHNLKKLHLERYLIA